RTPHPVLRQADRLSAALRPLRAKNSDRRSKHPPLPSPIAFRDAPSTRPDKPRKRPSSLAVLSNHPSVAPHVHCIVVLHPTLADRFLEIVPSLEATWRGIPVRTADPMSAFRAPMPTHLSLHAHL